MLCRAISLHNHCESFTATNDPTSQRDFAALPVALEISHFDEDNEISLNNLSMVSTLNFTSRRPIGLKPNGQTCLAMVSKPDGW